MLRIGRCRRGERRTWRGPRRDGDPDPRHPHHHVRADRVLVGVPVVVGGVGSGPHRGPYRLGRGAAPDLRDRRRGRGRDRVEDRARPTSRSRCGSTAPTPADIPESRRGFASLHDELHQVHLALGDAASTPRTRRGGGWPYDQQNACNSANWDSVGVYVKLNHKFLTKLFGAQHQPDRPRGVPARARPDAAVPVARCTVHRACPRTERAGEQRLLHGVVRADVRRADRVRGPRDRVQPLAEHRDRVAEGRRRRRARRRGVHARERRQQGVHDRADDRVARTASPTASNGVTITDRAGQAAQPAQGHGRGHDQEPVGGIVGYNITTIVRSAVAEYQLPQNLGSPQNTYGNDPESAAAQPQFWGNLFGPSSSKDKGDAIQSAAPPPAADSSVTPTTARAA